MSLTDEERNAIVALKVQKAKDTYEQAAGIAQLGYWNAAVNRLYYACYYIVSALLLINKHNAQTHSGVIRLFGLHFISKNTISKDLGRFYSKLYEMRQTGDYDDVYNFLEEDVKPLIEPTKQFNEYIEIQISIKN